LNIRWKKWAPKKYIPEVIKYKHAKIKLITDYFGEFLHNIILALALWDVSHKQTTVWYGGVHLQFFTWSDQVTIKL